MKIEPEISVAEKRKRLFDFCEIHSECCGCVLNEPCKCGRGAHFREGWGLSDSEIDNAYYIVCVEEPEFFKRYCVPADPVNHPTHYETGKFECIEVMREAIGLEAVKDFCLCNAFKYIYRCTKKHEAPTEDVKKAAWYLNKFLELEE